jgi:hypothetical protein
MRNKKAEIEDDRWKKLCRGFYLLDDRDKEYMLGILQALNFASKKREGVMIVDTLLPQNGGERQGTV